MNIRCLFPAVLDTLAYSCSRHITKPATSCRFLSCGATLLTSNPDKAEISTNNSNVITEKFVNRNPRTLEMMGLAKKRKGWNFQYPPVTFYHKVTLDTNYRNTTARVVHTSGKVVLSASTKENAISKYLYSNGDVSAAENIGRVLAQRCLESGIVSITLHPNLESSTSEKVIKFCAALEAGGIDLAEPEEIAPKYQPGIEYDNPELMADLAERRRKVARLTPFHRMLINLNARRRHAKKFKGPMTI